MAFYPDFYGAINIVVSPWPRGGAIVRMPLCHCSPRLCGAARSSTNGTNQLGKPARLAAGVAASRRMKSPSGTGAAKQT